MAALTFKSDPRLGEEQREKLRTFCGETGGEIVELANDLGVKVYEEDLWPYESGYLEYKPTCGSPSNYRIVVNRRHAPERKRFTVAHELAHFLLHLEDDGFDIKSETRHRTDDFFEYLDVHDQRQESEANSFAAAVLMPPNLFIPAYTNMDGSIPFLAKSFFVSSDAVQRRIKELGI